jgi:putative ABC transport system permease protein
MFSYYLRLAFASLRRNVLLTGLMIVAVAMGIGMSMTVLTVLIAMSGDPIPHKSGQLFAVQIDAWGTDSLRPDGEPADQLTYIDAAALMQQRKATRQTAMYEVGFTVTPEDESLPPFGVDGRATYSDFFAMFDVPLEHGSPWSTADDEAQANVVVLGHTLSTRLYGRDNPVGRTITLGGRDYRIVGVLAPWEPQPKFYDVVGNPYADTEDVYLPFTLAIARQMPSTGDTNCVRLREPGWTGLLNSSCIWNQFWVELPTAADEASYREFLAGYAEEQRRAGRFDWPSVTRLRDVREWLAFREVVRDEERIATLVAFGFLLVCLVNAIGLMLARFSSRAGELSVRRALGASRSQVFAQCLVETAVIGLAGGLLGILLTLVGLSLERAILPEDLGRLARLDGAMVVITLLVAVGSTVLSGVYPTWRASRAQPAWQLKAQ